MSKRTRAEILRDIKWNTDWAVHYAKKSDNYIEVVEQLKQELADLDRVDYMKIMGAE